MSARRVFRPQGGASPCPVTPLGSGRQGSVIGALGAVWVALSLGKICGKAQRELLPPGRTRFPVCHLPPFQDKESMRQVMQAVDKANGYSFGDQEHRSLEALMSAAVGADFHFTSYPSLLLGCVEF